VEDAQAILLRHVDLQTSDVEKRKKKKKKKKERKRKRRKRQNTTWLAEIGDWEPAEVVLMITINNLTRKLR